MAGGEGEKYRFRKLRRCDSKLEYRGIVLKEVDKSAQDRLRPFVPDTIGHADFTDYAGESVSCSPFPRDLVVVYCGLQVMKLLEQESGQRRVKRLCRNG